LKKSFFSNDFYLLETDKQTQMVEKILY